MSDQPHGLFEYLRRRIIVISTMERDVRIAFLAGAGMVLISAATNLLRNDLGPEMRTVYGTIPLGILILLAMGEFVVFSCMSLALLLMRGRPLFAGYGLALISFIMFVWANEYDRLSFALLLPIAMLILFAVLAKYHKWLRRDYILAALSTSLVAMLIFVLYLVANRQFLITGALGWQMVLAALGLVIAGTDLAEVVIVSVEGTTSRIKKALGGLPLPLSLAVIASAAEVLLARSMFPTLSLSDILIIGSAPAAFFALISWAIISWRKSLGSVGVHIEYRVLFLIVALYFFAFCVGGWALQLSDPATFDPMQGHNHAEIFRFAAFTGIAFFIAFILFGHRSDKMFVALAYGFVVGFCMLCLGISHGNFIFLFGPAIGIMSLFFLGLGPLSYKFRCNYSTACWLIAELNVELVAYAAITNFFLASAEDNGGKIIWTVSQALLVSIAFGWDLISSGGTITNKHTDTFPRLARVVLFVSYISSAALFVMVSVAGNFITPSTGRPLPFIFNSEGLVAVGLAWFGAPLIFVMAMVRLRNLLSGAEAPSHSKAGLIDIARTLSEK